jgi:signal transduction histidine kinase
LARARAPEDYQAVLASCLTLCTQMQVLVDNLLSLARLEAGAVAVAAAPCDISTLMDDCWQSCAERSSSRSLGLLWTVPTGIQAVCDREKLRVVLANLFENAVSYCDAGGRISVSAGIDGHGVTVRVSNSGCGLTPDQVTHVFDRFWRADASRSADGGHAGLGLALVRTLVDLMQGTITITVDQGMFIVHLTLPSSKPVPPDAG